MANKLGAAVEDLPLEVYTPAPALGEWAGLPSAMARDMASARELGWRLFVRDAPRSTGRACWALPGHCSLRSPPGSSSSCLQSKQVLALGDTAIPYPVYVLLGTTYWQIFVEALNAPLKSVTAAKPILARIAFPREALILSSAYLVVFNALVKSVVLVGVFLYFDVSLSVGLLFVPLAVGLLILLPANRGSTRDAERRPRCFGGSWPSGSPSHRNEPRCARRDPECGGSLRLARERGQRALARPRDPGP
jgi:lipopolysaccharide transport system permease protein